MTSIHDPHPPKENILSKRKVKSILFNLLNVTSQMPIEILLLNIKKVEALP